MTLQLNFRKIIFAKMIPVEHNIWPFVPSTKNVSFRALYENPRRRSQHQVVDKVIENST
jgi:hypothetical protein